MKILFFQSLFLLLSFSLFVTGQQQITWPKDGADLVLIPSGAFEMGDHLDNMSNALPVHTVTLDGFYMDKTEVTVGQFKAFLADSDYSWGGSWDEVDQYSPSDDHPMIYINYDDALDIVDVVDTIIQID